MAIVGAGIGAAMQGMRPVVEIMYEDFLTLAMEQIVNQAAKHRYMSGGQLKVPLTIRTQGGAGWSPGAQHAQQLEAWFVHIPGLKVVFAVDARRTCAACSGRRSTTTTRSSSSSTARCTGSRSEVPEELEPIPLGKARVHREGEDVTVIATGRLVHEALAAAEEAEKEGVSVEVVDPRTLQPLDEEAIVASVKKTNRCVVAHEAVDADGLRRRGRGGRPVQAFDWLDAPIERVGAKFTPLAVRAGDGGVRRPARRRRARGDPANGRTQQMATEVKLPRLGQGMESGTIVKWLKSEGDTVEKGEPLYELDTDKVTQEVEAEASGVLLKIAVAEGEVPVGTTIAFIGEQGEEVARRAERADAGGRAPSEPAEEPGAGTRGERSAAGGRSRGASRRRSAAGRRRTAGVKASPLARRIARERGIDLAQSPAPGPEGRDRRRGRRARAASQRRRPRSPRRRCRPRASRSQPLTSMRKTIARRLTEAWQAPVFQLGSRVDMTRAPSSRERLVELHPDERSRPSPTCSRRSAPRR